MGEHISRLSSRFAAPALGGLSLATFSFVAWYAEIRELADWPTFIFWAIPGATLSLAAPVIAGLRWRHAISQPGVGSVDLVRFQMVRAFANEVAGTIASEGLMWGFLRKAYRIEHVQFAKSAIAFRGLDIAVLACSAIGAGTLSLWPDGADWWVYAIVAALGMAGVLILTPGSRGIVWLETLGLWLSVGLCIICSARALGAELDLRGGVALIACYMGAATIPIPGKLGAHEAGWIAGLVLGGHSLPRAFLIALGTHVLFFSFLFLGLWVAVVLGGAKNLPLTDQ